MVDRSRAEVISAEAPPAAAESRVPLSRASVPKYHPLRDVASIFEATVVKTWNAYDDRLGPRMYVALGDVQSHLGDTPRQTVFSQLGGEFPDGRFLDVSGVSEFDLGSRYFIFVGRQASVPTPVWGGLAFRLEEVGGKRLVIGPDGTAVTRFSGGRMEFDERVLIPPWDDLAIFRDRPKRRLPLGLAEDSPGVKGALTAEEFLAEAVQATVELSDVVGVSVDLEPSDAVRWDVVQAVASKEDE